MLLVPQCLTQSFYFFSLEDMFTDFRERGREREREKHRCERETSIGCLPFVFQLGIEPTSFLCTEGWHSNQLSHPASPHGVFNKINTRSFYLEPFLREDSDMANTRVKTSWSSPSALSFYTPSALQPTPGSHIRSPPSNHLRHSDSTQGCLLAQETKPDVLEHQFEFKVKDPFQPWLGSSVG